MLPLGRNGLPLQLRGIGPMLGLLPGYTAPVSLARLAEEEDGRSVLRMFAGDVAAVLSWSGSGNPMVRAQYPHKTLLAGVTVASGGPAMVW